MYQTNPHHQAKISQDPSFTVLLFKHYTQDINTGASDVLASIKLKILPSKFLYISGNLPNFVIMSSNPEPSTLKSYVDGATGAIQSGIASVTGNSGDQVGCKVLC